MRTAILVDGGFYRRRAQIALGYISAQERAFELANYCKRHLETQIDLSKTDLYIWMNQFLNELKRNENSPCVLENSPKNRHIIQSDRISLKNFAMGVLSFQIYANQIFVLK